MPTFIKLPSGRIIALAHITDILTGDDYVVLHMSDGHAIALKIGSEDAAALMQFMVAVEAVRA